MDDWTTPAAAPWQPWMTRAERAPGRGESYVPCVTRASQWFGERLPGGGVRPIGLASVRKAFRAVKGLSAADVQNVEGEKVRTPTVATEEDMRSMIGALTRLGFTDVVFVADRVYGLDGDKVVPFPAPPDAPSYSFPAYEKTVQWFGEKQENGEIRPISTQYVLQSFRALEGITVTEKKGSGGKLEAAPDVATGRDIRLAVRALTEMGFQNVVFVAGRVYEVRKDKLASSEIPRGLRPPGAGPGAAKWFGERQKDGSIRPIAAAPVRSALNSLTGLSLIEIRNERGHRAMAPTVATEKDILSMIRSLSEGGFKNVVLVGRRLYEVRAGKLLSSEIVSPDERPSFAVYHNVAPLEKKKTYGARGGPDGCLDCHSENSPFFTKMKIVNPGRFLRENYPVPKEPNAEPQMYGWGIRSVPAHE